MASKNDELYAVVKYVFEDGNWNVDLKGRKAMVDKGIRKDLGCSWINAYKKTIHASCMYKCTDYVYKQSSNYFVHLFYSSLAPIYTCLDNMIYMCGLYT